jgi:hypothetical protein
LLLCVSSLTPPILHSSALHSLDAASWMLQQWALQCYPAIELSTSRYRFTITAVATCTQLYGWIWVCCACTYNTCLIPPPPKHYCGSLFFFRLFLCSQKLLGCVDRISSGYHMTWATTVRGHNYVLLHMTAVMSSTKLPAHLFEHL